MYVRTFCVCVNICDIFELHFLLLFYLLKNSRGMVQTKCEIDSLYAIFFNATNKRIRVIPPTLDYIDIHPKLIFRTIKTLN